MRVVILYSETGGGHRAAARAIEASLKEIRPDVEVMIRDGLVEGGPWPLNKAPAIYAWCMHHARWLWAFTFHLWNSPRRARWMVDLGFPATKRRLRRLLESVEADLLVSVHPLLTRTVARTIAKFPRRPPFAVVVTDLVTGHWSWYDAGADLHLVPTEGAKSTMIQGGMDAAKIHVTGQAVHARCGRVLDQRPALRDRFGWSEPVILFVGGGDGTGDLGSMVRASAAAHLPARLVVVCGRNEALRQELSASTFEVPVEVHGFVDNLHELMAAADILVTKGGPGSLMEGAVAGLPMLVYDFIPGQEKGNVQLIESQGIGRFTPHPSDLIPALKHWLSDPTARAAAASASRSLARPDSAHQIAQHLLSLSTKSTQ